MKAVILAGGFGTRLSEETQLKPKPMVEIGGKPIIWHIMKIYSAHGVNDFVICCGYKGYIIKEFFHNYFLHSSDVTISLGENSIQVHSQNVEPWNVTLIDTGPESMTGGRLKRVAKYIGEEDFCLTYGDGLSDVDITEQLKFHKEHGKLATVCAVAQPGRFGTLSITDSVVESFNEKPLLSNDRINGGFFILNPKVLTLIEGDDTIWENEPLKYLAENKELMSFKHDGFWQPMDTLREKNILENLWQNGEAPWKIW